MFRNWQLKRINKKLKKWYGVSHTERLELEFHIATEIYNCTDKLSKNPKDVLINYECCVDCIGKINLLFLETYEKEKK